MLEAARVGNWDHVVKLEGACALLIAQLKNTAAETAAAARRGAAQVAHHAAHPDQRRRDPPARRALARGPRRHARRPAEDAALIGASQARQPKRSQGDAMETRPAPLRGMSTDDGLDEFRVSSPREVGSAAQAAARRLGAAQPERQRRPRLHAARSGRSTRRAARSASTPTRTTRRCSRCCIRDEVTVVGYLDSVKVQFDVQNLVLVHGNKASVLSCPFPREMFRFQRRNAFRVRPLMRSRADGARCATPTCPTSSSRCA